MEVILLEYYKYCDLLKGVTIGNGSVIGTHALVTKNVPPNTVVAGFPAKVLQENIEWSDTPKAKIHF